MNDPLRSYETPAALRRALTDRLRRRAMERSEDLQRLHRLVAFDRVLARLYHDGPSGPWIVKGGCALELRYRLFARATVDLDLSVSRTEELGSTRDQIIAGVLERLRLAVERDIGDGFEVRIHDPIQNFAAPPQGGARFPVDVRLAGKRFGRFHLDVGVGDAIIGESDVLAAEEFLTFAGIPAARVAVLPIAQQIAEKLHAYTLPRAGPPNTRVKDLVDLVLILERETPNTSTVRLAIEATFSRRGTHTIPHRLPSPPPGWDQPYEALSKQAELTAGSAAEGHRRVAEFWSNLGFPNPNAGAAQP